MQTVQSICDFFEEFAPPRLAEDWDNVGLLVGDSRKPLERVMTCLTITPASLQEAIQQQADLIVAHHPLPFKPLNRLTTQSTSGRMLLEIISAGISVYSPHTAFDSAASGINQQLAEGLGLKGIGPLAPFEDDPNGLGAGRWGELAEETPLQKIVERLKQFLSVEGLHRVGASQQPIKRVAVACGSAGQFLQDAARTRCQLLITGETSFHTCLEAESLGLSLLLPGHYASERFAVEQLAAELAKEFEGLTVWPSRQEADPLSWV